MITRKIVLHFPPRLVDEPIVYKLVKDFGLQFNILKAFVTPNEKGLLVLELKGDDAKYEQGIDYLKNANVEVQPLSQEVVRNEDKCIHCSVCTGYCPTHALAVDKATRKVNFDDEKCIACGLCVTGCPYNAMEVKF